MHISETEFPGWNPVGFSALIALPVNLLFCDLAGGRNQVIFLPRFSQGPSNFKALKEANLPMWATRVALGRHGRRDSGCAVGKPVVRAQCPCGASVMSSAAGTRLKASQENHK